MELPSGEGEPGREPGVLGERGEERDASARGDWTLDRVLVIAGFIAMVLAVVILVTGDSSLVGPLLILLLPGIVSTGLLLWRSRPWIYLAAGFANSLVAITATPFGLFGALANPLVGPVYDSVVLATLSLFLALPAGVMGFLRGRAGFRQRSLAEGIRSLQGFVAVALVALSIGAMAAGSLAYQNLPTPVPSPAPAYDIPLSANVTVLTAGSRFSPSALNITACVVTKITVLNEDDMLHTFTYTNNGTTYSHDLLPGSTTRFFVLFATPGSAPFWSVPDRDSGMNGTITVVST